MKDIRNILVIKSGALGDLIAGTTALRAIRIAFPSATITALSTKLMYDVCPPGSLVDDILTYSNDRVSVGEFLLMSNMIRARRFNIAVNLRWSSEGSALLAWLSGAPMRVGSGPNQLRILYTHRAPIVEGRRHEFQRHLDVVRALDVAVGEPDPYLHITENDRSYAANFIRDHSMKPETTITMHPGASTSSKAWLPERYIELGKLVVSRFPGVNILVTGGPGEESLTREVSCGIGAGAVLGPPTSIGQLGALVSASTLCICNYSGVMNVAMAVKTPLVALGCTSAEDWGPYGELHRTVNAESHNDSYTEAARSAAMKSISVECVMAVVAQRWNELHLCSKQSTVHA